MSPSGSIEAKNLPLVVIVTRLGHRDEWKDWGFREAARVAFIKKSSIQTCDAPQDLSSKEVETRAKEDDVWVLNGRYFWLCNFKLLGKIKWSEIQEKERGFIKYIHTGQSTSLKDTVRMRMKTNALEKLASKEERENAESFFEDPEPSEYTLRGNSLRANKGIERVADFALAIRDGKIRTEYDNALKVFHIEVVIKHFLRLKRQFSALFTPLSVDLQGWRDSGFSHAYTEAIQKEYGQQRWEEKKCTIFEEARSIIYSVQDGSHSITIEGLIGDLIDDKAYERIEDISRQTIIEHQWGMVKNKMPNKSFSNYDDQMEPKHTLDLIASLDDWAKRKELKEKILEKDSLYSWVNSVESALDKVLEALWLETQAD